MNQRYLTVKQAAEYLGTSVQTLYTQRYRRELPDEVWRPFGKRGVRIDVRALDAWMQRKDRKGAQRGRENE